MESLLNELLTNISIRLLSKQIAQMRSVSKSSNAFLSQPSFIKSHLHRSIHQNIRQILLLFHEEQDYKPFTAKSCQSPNVELVNFIKHPVNPQPEDINGIKIIGSFNDLICSRYGGPVIQIWNPSLSTVLTLPPYSTPSRADNPIRKFRFGYDPKTDDYKLVKLTGLTGPSKYAVKWWLPVEIYSMRKGAWELITGRFPSHITDIIDWDYVCVDGHDGHIHWIGCNNQDFNSKTVVAFNLGSDTFHEIPLPHSTLDRNRYNVLGVLAEKLCVISQVRGDDTCEVWVMDEYGVAESWVKHHVFSQFTYNTCPFGFTSHSEFLIKDDVCCLVLYHPYANKQKILVEDVFLEEHDVDKIVEYVDSLVWVKPAEHEMVDGGAKS